MPYPFHDFLRTKMLVTSLLLLATCFHPSGSQAQLYFGGGMKFNNNKDFKALGLNGKVAYGISDKFDINSDITYYLAAKASWSFDFDLHYKLFNISEKVYFRPFAGINFTRTSITNNSLSLGASIRVPSDKFTYYAEPRYILDGGMFIFSAGITYPVIED